MGKRQWCLTAIAFSVAFGLGVLERPTLAAAEPERKVVFSEGFEGDGKVTPWALEGTYDVTFAGPTEERAATGKRSFKIDVTWIDCRYQYWLAPRMIPYYGNPVVRGKLYVERGDASIGHVFAVPEARLLGGVVGGQKVCDLPEGWAEWRSSALGTPGEATYLQGVAVYLRPDKEQRTVIYVDDLEVEAALPEGYEAELRARIVQIEAKQNAALQRAATTLPTRFAKLAAEMDAAPAEFPASASAELKQCWQRLRQYCAQVRSQLEAEIERLKTEPTPSAVGSARRLLPLLEKAHASCSSLAAYAAAHPTLPYVVWIVDPTSNEKVLPDRFPVPGIVGTEVSVSACAGEYEPASFALQAIKDLRDVTVECSGAETGEFTLPSSQIDIRIVKCWWQAGVGIADVRNPTLTPELLLKDPDLVRVDDEAKRNVLRNPKAPRDATELQPVTTPAGTTQQFWVTVHVPENAPPGNYRAAIDVRATDLPALSLPLTIEVLPFPLEPSPLQHSIYYTGLLSDDVRAETELLPPRSICAWKNERQYLAEMLDLRAHGFTHPTCYQGFGELLDRVIELRKQAGIATDPFYSLGMGTGAPSSPEELKALKERVRSGLAQVRKHGIKELYIYGIDEASGEELKAERAAFNAVHEVGAKVFVACHAGTFELVGDLLDLAVSGLAPIPGEAEKWHSVGHRIFNYGCPQCGMELPETYRRNYGLLLWQAGYDGAMNWAYHSAFNDHWDDFDHPSYREHSMVYSTIDGVVPTIQWEGFREGVDGVRYVATLLKAIEHARAHDGKAELAGEAERWIEEMDIGGDLEALRAEMVEWILRLSK